MGLANIRIVQPGRIFYNAFHLIPWYGLFLIFLLFQLNYLLKLNRKLGAILYLVIFAGLVYFIYSPNSYINDKISPHEDLINNYGYKMQVGEVIKKLSKPSDTLFLDGFDDIIYWQANRLSPYPYSWYTSIMPQIPIYAQARLNMFANNPPDFYYGTCPDKKVANWTMPKKYLVNYQQLYSKGQPTCLYIHKEKLPEITKSQWEKVNYEL